MNAPQEPAPEPMEDKVSPELRDDLRSLFGARVTVPPSVDEAVLAAARHRFVRRRDRTRLVRWVAVASGAAAVLLFSLLAQHVLRLPYTPEATTKGKEYIVNLQAPDPPSERVAAEPHAVPDLPSEIVIRFPQPPEVPTPPSVPPIKPPEPEVVVAVAPLPPPFERVAAGTPEPTEAVVASSYYFAGRIPLPDGSPQAVAWPGGAEELWVIARPRATPTQAAYESPGSGAFVVRLPDAKEHVPMPLERTDVRARLKGHIATVDVCQTFRNPHDFKVEAIYAFPLPYNSAVTDFVLTVGDRRIRGVIREREDAEAIYRAAVKQGILASLYTQDRPTVFTQRVANIEPGRQIDVEVRYFGTLAFVDGWYEFVFPLIDGPRFAPPGSAEHIRSYRRDGKEPYERPKTRDGRALAVQVDIEAGVPLDLDDVVATHAVRKRRLAGDRAQVTLAPRERLANRDFVLRYRVADRRPRRALLLHRDERGGFFSLMLYPPREVRNLPRRAVELLLVVDGPLPANGKGLRHAKQAAAWALSRLTPDDTFLIIRSTDKVSPLGAKPLRATKSNVRRGLEFLAALRDGGAFSAGEGLETVLRLGADARRLRHVVLITHGALGSDAEAVASAARLVGEARLFCMGIGENTNDTLLNHLARVGRGAVAYIGKENGAAKVMDFFLRRTLHPMMTDIEIDWGRMKVSDVYPAKVPDLVVGRPVVLTGRFEGAGRSRVRVKGVVGDQAVQFDMPVDLADAQAQHEGLPSVWALARVAELTRRARRTGDSHLRGEIVKTALDYGLVSPFTAFLAIDSLNIIKAGPADDDVAPGPSEGKD